MYYTEHSGDTVLQSSSEEDLSSTIIHPTDHRIFAAVQEFQVWLRQLIMQSEFRVVRKLRLSMASPASD